MGSHNSFLDYINHLILFAGFLCGQCLPQSEVNKTQGLAFNLLQCVTCDAMDAVLFALICEQQICVSQILRSYIDL